MRALITGAAGFVGHHIVECILKNTNWEIVTIDRLLETTKHGFDRIKDIECYDPRRVSLFTHDLNLPIGTGLRKEIGSIDYILDVASESHVDRSIASPVPFILNNVTKTLNMLEFASSLPNLRKFLQFSTDEVYGAAPYSVDYKEGDPHNPGNPYSASKSAQEMICRAYSNTYGIPIVITNTMNVIGERQHSEKFLPLIINKVLTGETLYIHSDSSKTRPGLRKYIHARNVANALVFILEKTGELISPKDISCGVFNIVGEKEFDNLSFAKLVASFVGKELKYELVDFHSSRPGHDLRYSLDDSKLLNYGFRFSVGIEEAISRTVKWTLRPENKKWLS